MAAKKKTVRKKKVCPVCFAGPQVNGELCDPCDESYEEWLTEKRGSSLAWAATRARECEMERPCWTRHLPEARWRPLLKAVRK